MFSPRSARNGLSLVFAAAALVLVLASTAFACTIFQGQMTVQGNGKDPATGKTSSITVVGNNRGMGYCGGSPTSDLPPGTGHTYVDRIEPSAASLDISVAPSSGSCASQLRDGVYNVNFFNGPGWTDTEQSRVWTVDCMFNQDESRFAPGVVKIGELTVSGGVGSGEYRLPDNLAANGPTDESSVCVANQPPQRALYGQMAPVTVL